MHPTSTYFWLPWALAMGMQSGAMVQLKIPGIVTTYITGTWTTLVSGLVRFARPEGQQEPTSIRVRRAAGDAGRGAVSLFSFGGADRMVFGICLWLPACCRG